MPLHGPLSSLRISLRARSWIMEMMTKRMVTQMEVYIHKVVDSMQDRKALSARQMISKEDMMGSSLTLRVVLGEESTLRMGKRVGVL